MTKEAKRIRKDLERTIVAWNTCLKDEVKRMSPIILLRNAPPFFRSDYAYLFRDNGLITKDDVSEFITTPIPRFNRLYR